MFIATPVKVLRRPLESAQYVSIRYTERLAEAGVEPSVGSVGDSTTVRVSVLPGEPDPSYD